MAALSVFRSAVHWKVIVAPFAFCTDIIGITEINIRAIKKIAFFELTLLFNMFPSFCMFDQHSGWGCLNISVCWVSAIYRISEYVFSICSC